MEFVELLKRDTLKAFVVENGFTTATKVQEQILPRLLRGDSLNVVAQTGTGKTLTYLLPIIEKMKTLEEEGHASSSGSPLAIVVSPTRELSRQIVKVAKSIAHHAKFRVRLLEGGDAGKNSRELKKETFDLLIANPGRLVTSIARKEISLSQTQFFVLDEADQLLDMGFAKDLEGVVKLLQPKTQVALFSATLHASMAEVQKKIFPIFKIVPVIVGEKNKLVQKVETYNIYLSDAERPSMLKMFLKKEGKELTSGIIFVSKKDEAQAVFDLIAEAYPKIPLSIIHGDIEANQRKKEYNHFIKNGGILVATDIAARGIDVKELAFVLNYTLPFEAVYYVHRAGRTGRMGALGRVYNFVTGKDQEIVNRINEAIVTQTALDIKTIKFPTVKKAPTVKKVERRPPLKRGGSERDGRSSSIKKSRDPRAVKQGPRFTRMKKKSSARKGKK